MIPALAKAFNMMIDDNEELSTENDASKDKIGYYDEKCLEDAKTKTLKEIEDEKR